MELYVFNTLVTKMEILVFKCDFLCFETKNENEIKLENADIT